MSESVDPRIQERRREVQGHRFRASVRRILWLLTFVTVGGLVAWLVQSPILAIDEIVIDGVVNTPIDEILGAVDLAAGDPLLLAATVDAEDRLRREPWVSDVLVRKVFPNTIEITVVERSAVAVLVHRTGDVLVAADGVVLAEAGSNPSTIGGTVRAVTAPGAVGSVLTDPFDLAAVAFLAAWNGETATVSVVDGELWAELSEYEVRLGGQGDMAQKAAALEAVLNVGQIPGSLINVMAPTRPTVVPPSEIPASAQP